jgi:hypothetical protein
MPEVVASYDAGADITCEASGAITGGRFVGVPAARNAGGPAGISDTGDGNLIVSQTIASAGSPVFGVAAHDAANGRKVDILRATKVVPVECSAAIAIGAQVQTGTDGRAATFVAGAGKVAAGIALSATTAAGQYCQVALGLSTLAST